MRCSVESWLILVAIQSLLSQVVILVSQHLRLQLVCLSEFLLVQIMSWLWGFGVLLLLLPEFLGKRLVLGVSVKLFDLSVVVSVLVEHRRSSLLFLAELSCEVLLLGPHVRFVITVETTITSTRFLEHLPSALLSDWLSEDLAVPSVVHSLDVLSLFLSLRVDRSLVGVSHTFFDPILDVR